MTAALKNRRCRSDVQPLDETATAELLAQVDAGWALTDGKDGVQRTFKFKNYYRTMAFVNALAWVAHQQDHHPELVVGYNRCVVTFSTHSVDGLSENDFICAAHIDALDSDTD